jgi:hypothetical protein
VVHAMRRGVVAFVPADNDAGDDLTGADLP